MTNVAIESDAREKRIQDNLFRVKEEATKWAVCAACPSQQEFDSLVSIACIGLIKGINAEAKDDELNFWIKTELNSLLKKGGAT